MLRCSQCHLSCAGRYGELRPVWSAFGSLSRARCLSYHADRRTRSPDAPHSADQVAPRLYGQYGRWDASRRSASFSGRSTPLCCRSSSKGHLRGAVPVPWRSMTSWRVDVGRPFVFRAGHFARPSDFHAGFAWSFSVEPG